jgi:predicted transcriptional regulator
MKKLTAAEEQIMHALWALPEGGFVKDVLEQLEAPKPHNNTVATLLKILVDKGFVGLETPGRNHIYRALVSKEAYSKQSIAGLAEKYFDGSFANVISFLVDKKQMSLSDLELLLAELKNKKNG